MPACVYVEATFNSACLCMTCFCNPSTTAFNCRPLNVERRPDSPFDAQLPEISVSDSEQNSSRARSPSLPASGHAVSNQEGISSVRETVEDEEEEDDVLLEVRLRAPHHCPPFYLIVALPSHNIPNRVSGVAIGMC